MTPANERKAKERQAKRDAGLVRVEVLAKMEDVELIRAYAGLLQSLKINDGVIT